MFDATANAEIIIGMRLEGGGNTLTVRWPTDEEWAKHIRSRKLLMRKLGRGVTENVPMEPSDADLALCQKILLNGAPPLNKAEAHQIMEVLGVCQATGCEIEGDWATIEMIVFTGVRVRHRLKIPTASQIVKFKRVGFRLLDLPFSQSQIQLFVEPTAQLWNDCEGSSEDYVDGVVPANHKDTAVRVLIDHIDRNLGPQRGDENF